MKILILCVFLSLFCKGAHAYNAPDHETLPPPVNIKPKGYIYTNPIDIYPSSGYLYINFNESLEGVYIEITDDFGSLIYFDQIDSKSGDSINIDCSQYSGTYTIIITDTEGNLLLEDTYLF